MRAGGSDKGLLVWRGKPLVEHVLEQLAPQVGQLLISCNRNLEAYSKLAPTIEDSRMGFQGPLAGLEAAHSSVLTPFLFVASCDVPQLPANIVQRLAAAVCNPADTANDAAFAHDGERGQYLTAIVRTQCLSSLTEYLDSGKRSVRGWLATQGALTVDCADQAVGFLNFNRLDDQGSAIH